jgi:hypothetical protein
MRRMSGPTDDLGEALRAGATRAGVTARVSAILGTDPGVSARIVDAFDAFVATPLAANLARLRGRELVRRNPMIYTIRGSTTVDEWVDQVLADKETSAIEGHLGTWLEEVAQIVSGGVKPGSGVDLQLERHDGVVELYAIQSAPNTKNAGSRRADVEALKRAAQPLRAHRKHVELKIAVLSGRAKTRELRDEPGIVVVGSDEFWGYITGVADFRACLFQASVVLSELVDKRSSAQVERIRSEARALFGHDDGSLNVNSLADPPPQARKNPVERAG